MGAGPTLTMNEFDIFVMPTVQDWTTFVVATDLGAVTAGSFNGVGLSPSTRGSSRSDPRGPNL